MPPIQTTAPTRTYSQQEALEASRNYFDGDDLAASVWLNKYALKDSQGNLYERTPDDMHRRIASELKGDFFLPSLVKRIFTAIM